MVRPNGMTKYSKWPGGVLKAVFHSSPAWMRMRWQAFLRSSLENLSSIQGFKNRINEGKRVLILHSYLIQAVIIKRRRRGRNKEKPSAHRGGRGTVMTSSLQVSDIFLPGFWLRQVGQLLRGKWGTRNKFNSTIIWSVWGLRKCFLFDEDLP